MRRIIRSLTHTLRQIVGWLRSIYHWLWALLGALIYRFPSRKLIVIAVTGTKGKTSETEYINAIFEAAGWRTAVANGIRFKIDDESTENTMRMSTPGRLFLQRFLHKAVQARCKVAILEMTSEGARQHRHKFIALDALVFTNLAPEHIESHGSFEKYAQAKLSIARAVARSSKRPRIIVANADDAYGKTFLSFDIEYPTPYSLTNAQPYTADDTHGSFTFKGTTMRVGLPGTFSLYNALAAATLAELYNIALPVIARGLATVTHIPGRAERIDEGQAFDVVVDYAHTPDSLEALYDAFKDKYTICVLGSMGGSRDKWKRPEMGRVAGAYCDRVIFTNEDPCDEDPENILRDMVRGVSHGAQTEVILDRREAIRAALSYAMDDSAVLITGKGTDPTIKVAHGKGIPWSDAQVAREELRALKKDARHTK